MAAIIYLSGSVSNRKPVRLERTGNVRPRLVFAELVLME
jgi:hypothetical protein